MEAASLEETRDTEDRAGRSDAAGATTSQTGKPLSRPEWAYFGLLIGVLAVGFLVAVLALDDGRTWTPGPEVSVFALLFVMTAAIERLIEIFTPFFGGTMAAEEPDDATKAAGKQKGGTKPLIGKGTALKKRRAASVRAHASQSAEERAQHAARVAFYDELLLQIRENRSTLWAVGAALGMLASAEFGILLLNSLNVEAAGRDIDILVTGLAMGGGTKALHELVSNVKASKDTKQTGTVAGA